MTFEELQAEYERLLRENSDLKEQNRFLTEDNSRFQIQIANMIKKGYNADYKRLLEENKMLKEKNAHLLNFKKANTPIYKKGYNTNLYRNDE